MIQGCEIVKLSARRNTVAVTLPAIPALVLDSVVLPVLCCTSLQKKPAGAATPLLVNGCGFRPPLLKLHTGLAVAVGVGVAVFVAVLVAVGVKVEVKVTVWV